MAKFVCDECRNETLAKMRTSDGRVLCAKCMKREKSKGKATKVKTADPFLKVARALDALTDNGATHQAFSCVRLDHGRRTFSNGRMLIADQKTWSESTFCIDLVSLKREKRAYGTTGEKIAHIRQETYDRAGDHVVEIPEDFYSYLRPFHGFKHGFQVVIAEDKITVRPTFDDDSGLELCYAGVNTNGSRAAFDGLMLEILKPKALSLSEDSDQAAVIKGSYAEGVPTATAIIMPMALPDWARSA